METTSNDEPKEEEETSTTTSQAQNPWAIPASIVIAGGLIALAVAYNSSSPGTIPSGDRGTAALLEETSAMKEVSSKDHILGDPNAPIKIVEYSDLECPFCKRFHVTMKQVMDEYGKRGEVAWVYRHLPLDALHPKARKQAEATECANKLGGNEKFWAYTDRIFEVTPSNNGLDMTLLPEIAVQVGLDRSRFLECLDGGEFGALIDASIADATNVGAQGTPFSLVVTKSGKKFPINGAQPYDAVKATIERALAAE